MNKAQEANLKRRINQDKYLLYNVTQRLFKKGLNVDQLFLIFYKAIFDRLIQIERETMEV